MRCCSGSITARTSSGVKRGVMYLGQFQSIGDDVDDDEALNTTVDADPVEEAGFGVRIEAGMPEQLQSLAVRIVDGDDRHPVVVIDVAGGDVLPVAAALGPGEMGFVDDLDEAVGTTAVLDGRPAVDPDRGEVEAVSLRQELDLRVTEAVRNGQRPSRRVEVVGPPPALMVYRVGIDGEVEEVFHGQNDRIE